jgi:peptidoglycan/LPS O-acetylase OafA/YrhL
MGIIRLLLALSVVAAHTTSFFGVHLVGGKVAVQAFYIISGFYMSLILNEKYLGKTGSYKLFITNRFLRIFPIFWTVLVLVALFSALLLILGHGGGSLQPYINYFSNGNDMNIPAIFLLVVSNLFLFGGDIVMFTGINPATGNLFFTKDFTMTSPRMHGFLLVPQAWTIALELMFYLIAPFLVRRKTWLIVTIIILSFGLRTYLYSHGLNHDPWTYRFFPLEIAFFLLGTLSYRVYTKIQTYPFDPKVLWIAFGSMCLATLGYYPGNTSLSLEIPYFALITFGIPLVFLLTKTNKYDARIGELSYPVYICHMLMIAVLGFFAIPEKYLGFAAAAGSMLLAWILIKVVSDPIERFRQRRVALAQKI